MRAGIVLLTHVSGLNSVPAGLKIRAGLAHHKYIVIYFLLLFNGHFSLFTFNGKKKKLKIKFSMDDVCCQTIEKSNLTNTCLLVLSSSNSGRFSHLDGSWTLLYL